MADLPYLEDGSIVDGLIFKKIKLPHMRLCLSRVSSEEDDCQVFQRPCATHIEKTARLRILLNVNTHSGRT